MSTRRSFLKNVSAIVGGAMALPYIGGSRFQLFAGQVGEYSARAIDLVQQSTVIDMLGLLTLDFPKLYGWQRDPQSLAAADFQKLKNSGITMFHPAVCYDGPRAYADSRNDAIRWNNLIARQPDYFVRIDRAGDLERAKASGKIGILLGQQNSDHFRTIDDVDHFYALGQRLSLLSYGSNKIGGGSADARNPGLTDFGAKIIQRMNKVGMLVDVAHCCDRTTLDAFWSSNKPVVISHSNCRALTPNRPRCKSDEAIMTMAATGGVIGISMIRGFLCASGQATIETVLDHIDHVVKVAGVEHVGIGSDVDLAGRACLSHAMLKSEHIIGNTDVAGLNYPKKIYDMTEGLIRRGYTDADIQLILGGNFQRVMRAVM